MIALPRIRAGDSLLWADRLGVGTGAVRKEDRAATIRRWRKESGAGDGTTARTPGGLMAALAAAGVPVRIVKRKPARSRRRRPA